MLIARLLRSPGTALAPWWLSALRHLVVICLMHRVDKDTGCQYSPATHELCFRGQFTYLAADSTRNDARAGK